MSRRHLTFTCEGSLLAGTLDEGEAATGLLIVSGGNELRAGAWSGQAQLAARIARAGYPVLRFDRRGVGDSDGPNGEFRSSAPDIAAALAAFRTHCPQLSQVVGMGNCDAASALMLAGGAGCDALILSNPWTIDDAAVPPQALRQHYRHRLADPAALRRLLTGQVSPRKLFASLMGAISPAPPPTGLVAEMAAGIAGFEGEMVFLLAERDRTAQIFLASWESRETPLLSCTGASHSFVEPGAQQWLTDQVLAMMARVEERNVDSLPAADIRHAGPRLLRG